MRVVIVANPSSGSGKARGVSRQIAQAAFRAGIETTEAEVGPAARHGHAFTPETLEGADALIGLGGDGTISTLARVAMRFNVPICCLPFGTANLFARVMRQPRSAEAAIKRLRHHVERRADIAIYQAGQVEGHMLITAGVGPDGSIVRRLHANRRGPISPLTYAGPIFTEIANPQTRVLSIEADGKTIVDNKLGWAVVANARPYALRVDPCPDADPFDGRLDLAFLPAASRAELLHWVWRLRCRRGTPARGAIRTRARNIEIRTKDLADLQIDGEAAATDQRFVFEVKPNALRVLMPA